MATKQGTIDYLLDQGAEAGPLSSKKMFGEYALYLGGKVFAFVCDDQLYVKPTDAGRAFLGTVEEAPAYPGSKMYFLITADRWEDGDWLAELWRVTAAALPEKKAKPARKRKGG